MRKPSIATLLRASGHSEFTSSLVVRATNTLYGHVGANLDERDWSTLMQSRDPLRASEDALRAMYQDSGYLLRNTQHLLQSGYVAAQAEITYRQMAGRLGYTYNSRWSDGSPYDNLGEMTDSQLLALVPEPPPPPPLPTISVDRAGAGFATTLNVGGTVALSVSGTLGDFTANSHALIEQSSLKEGFLTLSANGHVSTPTSQYVVLGTSGGDTYDAGPAGDRVDYLFGGAGNDQLRGGEGNDILFGGTGNDTLLGNEDDDLIHGGEGNDNVQAGQGNDTVYGEAGDDVIQGGSTGDDVLDGGPGHDHITGGTGIDTLTGGEGNDRFYFALSGDLFADGQAVDAIDGGAGTNTLVLADSTLVVQDSFDITAPSSWSRIARVSRIEAEGPYGAQFNLSLGNDAYEAGLREIDLSADTETIANANFIDVSAETGASNGYKLTGHAGMDFITGGAGNDSITGGAGADNLSGGHGNDVFHYTDNLQLRSNRAVDGGDGFDAIVFSAEIDTLTSGSAQGDNFHADFWRVTSVERIQLFGASRVNLGDVLPGVGVTHITTGDGDTTLRYDNIVLGVLTIDAAALSDGKTLTLTQFAAPGPGQWFDVTGLKGNVDAATLQGGIAVTAAAGSGFDVSVVGGDGNDTLLGGVGNDILDGGGDGADVLHGGAGVDVLYLGIDRRPDQVRADEGEGQLLVASEIAHLDSDRIEHFHALDDKFLVSGAGTSVVLNGVAAAQAAGTPFQDVASGAFDLNDSIGGAYITGAAVGNLRAFNDVKTAIGALANESVGEEAYFVLRDSGGNVGVYHFRSVTANNEVDVGEIELLGLILTAAGSDLTGLAASNFVFA